MLLFAPWVDLPLAAVTRAMAREWWTLLQLRRSSSVRHKKRKRRLEAQTLRNILNLVRLCFDDAVKDEDEELTANPFASLKLHRSRKAKTAETSTVLFPVEQFAGLGALALLPERELVAFALFSGVRQGEQWSLRLPDVTDEGARIRVTLRYGSDEPIEEDEDDGPRKNGKVHTITLPPRAADALVFPSRKGRRRCAGKSFRGWRYLEMAVGRHVRWHDLRHSFATSMVSGWFGPAWSLEALCVYLDHSSVQVTEKYARLAKELAERAVDKMAPTPVALSRVPVHVPLSARRPRARRRSAAQRGKAVNNSKDVDAETASGENAGNGAVAKWLGNGLQNRVAPPEGGGSGHPLGGTTPELTQEDSDRAREVMHVASFAAVPVPEIARLLMGWRRELTARANQNAEELFRTLKALTAAERRAEQAEDERDLVRADLDRYLAARASSPIQQPGNVYANEGENVDGNDRSGEVRRVQEVAPAGDGGAGALRGGTEDSGTARSEDARQLAEAAGSGTVVRDRRVHERGVSRRVAEGASRVDARGHATPEDEEALERRTAEHFGLPLAEWREPERAVADVRLLVGAVPSDSTVEAVDRLVCGLRRCAELAQAELAQRSPQPTSGATYVKVCEERDAFFAMCGERDRKIEALTEDRDAARRERDEARHAHGLTLRDHAREVADGRTLGASPLKFAVGDRVRVSFVGCITERDATDTRLEFEVRGEGAGTLSDFHAWFPASALDIVPTDASLVERVTKLESVAHPPMSFDDALAPVFRRLNSLEESRLADRASSPIPSEPSADEARARRRVAEGLGSGAAGQVSSPASSHCGVKADDAAWAQKDSAPGIQPPRAPDHGLRPASIPEDAFRSTELVRERPTRPEVVTPEESDERELLHLSRDALRELAKERTIERDAARGLFDAEKRAHLTTKGELLALGVRHRVAQGLLNDVDRVGVRISMVLDAENAEARKA